MKRRLQMWKNETNVPRLLCDPNRNRRKTIITTMEILGCIAFSHRTLSVDRNNNVPHRNLLTHSLTRTRNEVENEIDIMNVCLCILSVIASDRSE